MQMSWPPPRKEYIKQQQALHGRKIFGVFPAVYPKELLWALNILPVEIWDPPLVAVNAGAHLQPTICSVVRQGLELILQGKCDDLDGFLFPHTCDSLQNLASIINDCLNDKKPCYFFYPPRASSQAVSQRYFLDQLRDLAKTLEARFGPLDSNELRKRVAQGQKIAECINQIYALRARGELDVSNADFYRAMRSGEYLFPDDYQQLLDTLAQQTGPEQEGSPCVILSGVLPNPPEILTLLDDQNVRIAEDDFLNCARRLRFAAAQNQDPFKALATQYFSLPPCSTRNSPIQERLEDILSKIETTGARGVIFYVVKFCEPELFDIPQLTAELKKQGLKTLEIDVELGRGLSGQMTTRVEAFIEIIKSKGKPASMAAT